MPADGSKLLERYKAFDGLLVEKFGYPATSPQWLAALSDFWLSGSLRMVVRKGRQVGASTIIAPRVCVVTCLFGEYRHTRGTRSVFGLSSTKQSEAGERLYNIEHAFRDAGIDARIRGDVLEVPNKPVVVQCYPATSDAARGANSWAWWEDEMPAWRDGDGANPAAERDAAIVPTGITHPNFRIYSVGTPMGMLDFHARLVDAGDTPQQRVYSGPSWHWNPTLTEERARQIAPNDRAFNREFAAQPQGNMTSVFDLMDIDRAMADIPNNVDISDAHPRIMAIDASRGNDAWTYAIVKWVKEKTELDPGTLAPAPSGRPWCLAVAPREFMIPNPDHQTFTRAIERQDDQGNWFVFDEEAACTPERMVLHVEELGEVPPKPKSDDELPGDYTQHAINFLSNVARRPRVRGFELERIRHMLLDQYDASGLIIAFRRAGITATEMPWTPKSKERAVDRLERLLRDGQIRIPRIEIARRQLAEYSEKITRTGSIKYEGKGHDDYAQVLVTVAMGDVVGEIKGSPYRAVAQRYRWGDPIPE